MHSCGGKNRADVASAIESDAKEPDHHLTRPTFGLDYEKGDNFAVAPWSLIGLPQPG